MSRHGRRQEEAGRSQRAGAEPRHRVLVEPRHDRLAGELVVERLLRGVQEHVVRRAAEVDLLVAARCLRLDLGQQAARDRVGPVKDVGAVVQHRQRVGRDVRRDLDVDVVVAGGNPGDCDRSPVGVLDHRERLVGDDVGHLVGPDARRRTCRLGRHRGAGRDDPERREREHVVERSVRRRQMNHDLARGVVGRDAADGLRLAR